MIKEEFPETFVTKLKQVEYSADKLFPAEEIRYHSPYQPASFSVPEELTTYVQENISKVDDRYALVPRNPVPQQMFFTNDELTSVISNRNFR